MSLSGSSSLHPALSSGDALPKVDGQQGGQHLFVSLSELILEHIFYHPSFESARTPLDPLQRSSIDAMLGEQDLKTHFVSTLVLIISDAIAPEHNVVRVSLSNADSHTMHSLLGGDVEPEVVNPALGMRGVSRYAQPEFSASFALECDVIKALRAQGHQVEIVVPFVRALSDAAKIIDLLAEQGLPRGLDGLKVLYTVDVPSSALMAERLLHYFDGVVINLENLTQYTLGIDRLDETLHYLFEPQSEAVLQLIDMTTKAAENVNKPVILTSSGVLNYAKIQEYLVEREHVELVVTV
ncbi:phosphoenolpyruvate synthase [Vibrio scophthalmi]|uniref:putative PEP-binding protein n=1 Tax=Vibrio scophthalmi TaxID=45658 RepID=UPI002FEFB2BB